MVGLRENDMVDINRFANSFEVNALLLGPIRVDAVAITVSSMRKVAT